ncbi:MAG TPA: antitoxin MazE family protein [Stellaceae bacterium]|nr:antitoxin MazE family protein [Stellaceae bacterium]
MPRPMSCAERVARQRAKLREAGLQPIQLWVPDTHAAGFSEECRHQSQRIREGKTAASLAEEEAWEAASNEASG